MAARPGRGVNVASDTTPRVDRVDAEGIWARGEEDLVLDVLFDDRRIWSFWLLRDSAAAPDGGRFTPWPASLARRLDGHARLTVRTHVDERVLHDQEASFGTSAKRIAVVDADGRPLGIDKSGKLTRTFETRTASQVQPLLDSLEAVLAALHEAGVEAFPAYGTLLGAVRDGALIGHDSDADIGYVSRHTTPVDVTRESFALERRLSQMGYAITRYSGAGFKVLVTESDGSTRGLDVFGGFISDGHLIVMGEIRVPFEEGWIFPLGTTTLEGRTLPAPADPDRFLAATYGPSWRVPDPAFVFTTPDSTKERLDDWFRGTRVQRSDWDARYQGRRSQEPSRRPDALARFLLEQERGRGADPALVVDVGCGRGQNTRWLAEQGLPSLGLDYSTRAFEYLQEWSARHPEVPLHFATMNLLDLRHVLGWGARLAHRPGPKVVLARHVADALVPAGRTGLWRFTDMLTRSGGRLYLEFLVAAAADDPWVARNLLRPLKPERVSRQLTRRGGAIVSRDVLAPSPAGPDTSGVSAASQRRVCRMVVEWTS
jgi:SAM-dependent methyltransferase